MADDIKITIVTPQFHRTADDPKPANRPPENFDDLRTMGVPALKELGLRAWNLPNDPEDHGRFPADTVLMLLPGEWYPHIPEGTEIVSIMGNAETFEPGETDDDIRFGCLSFGILVKP